MLFAILSQRLVLPVLSFLSPLSFYITHHSTWQHCPSCLFFDIGDFFSSSLNFSWLQHPSYFLGLIFTVLYSRCLVFSNISINLLLLSCPPCRVLPYVEHTFSTALLVWSFLSFPLVFSSLLFYFVYAVLSLLCCVVSFWNFSRLSLIVPYFSVQLLWLFFSSSHSVTQSCGYKVNIQVQSFTSSNVQLIFFQFFFHTNYSLLKRYSKRVIEKYCTGSVYSEVNVSIKFH